MGLTDFPGASAPALDRIDLPDERRREPRPSTAPPPILISDIKRLDPARTELGPQLRRPKRAFPYGAIVSLLIHLLPFLLLLEWPRNPPEVETPIPIQLVLEQPPPPPPPPAPKPAETKPPPKPPKARFASDDFGDPDAHKNDSTKDASGKDEPPPFKAEQQSAAAEAPAEKPQPTPSQATERQSVLVAPPPVHLNEQLSGDFQLPTDETLMASLVPPAPAPPAKPAPPKERAVMHVPNPMASSWPLPLRQAQPNENQRSARFRGPAAVRDENLALMKEMILKQIGLLPLSATGTRHGQTQLSLRVLGDGTINSVKVETGSGYPDIDQRIERMVLAVGRFPPLPAWMGPYMDFVFSMQFPHPLQR